MEARNSWSFPRPKGEPELAPFFSNQIMHWKQYYLQPVEEIINEANRIGKEGMYGMMMSFQPGYATGSFYKETPFPTDLLPYALTGFAYREANWKSDKVRWCRVHGRVSLAFHEFCHSTSATRLSLITQLLNDSTAAVAAPVLVKDPLHLGQQSPIVIFAKAGLGLSPSIKGAPAQVQSPTDLRQRNTFFLKDGFRGRIDVGYSARPKIANAFLGCRAPVPRDAARSQDHAHELPGSWQPARYAVPARSSSSSQRIASTKRTTTSAVDQVMADEEDWLLVA